MREKDNDEFWLVINWLNDLDYELSIIKRKTENILTDIRHKRSSLMDYILDDENKTVEED